MAAKRHAGGPAATKLEEAASKARRMVILGANIVMCRSNGFSRVGDVERSG